MKRLLFAFFYCLLISNISADEYVLVNQQDWHGFVKRNYKSQEHGYHASVVLPQSKAASKSWIWRARFFGHQPQLDFALLKQGYHLVYCDVSQLFGSDTAVNRWNHFYKWVRKEFDLREKVVLEGMSRGGLIVYRWGIQNPEKVSAIYADAPVIDPTSWPGGLGQGKGGSPSDWDRCKEEYGVLDGTILSDIIVGNLDSLAKNKVPLIHVVGTEDKVVPVGENTDPLVRRYHELGGSIVVIKKFGVGHHPHSLNDPDLILSFFSRFAL